MAKSFRQKNVSKKLKRNIRGGDKTSAAKKIQRLFRKGQSKKNKSAKKIQNLVRQVQSKKKKNKSAKKIQSIARAFSVRNSIKKKHPKFKQILNDAVNIVKSRQCGICLDSIKPGEKFVQCPNKNPHMFHTDCLSGWCSAAHSNGRQSPVNPNIWQTKCPLCRDFMNCPGSSDDIQSRQRQNRIRHDEEQFREFQQRELAAQNSRQPAILTQRLAEQQDVQHVLDAINAAEADIIANIEGDIREYRSLTHSSCLRYIETELEDYISITHDIELDTYINSRPVRIAKDAAKTRIVNAIAEYCVQNILIPQMQREFDTAAQGRSMEELRRRYDSELRTLSTDDNSIGEAIYVHQQLGRYRRNVSSAVDEWWNQRNKAKLEVIMADYKAILGDFVVLASEQDIRRRRVENVRQIGDFNFGDVDNDMYLYKFFDIYQYDVEKEKDIDDLIESFEEALHDGDYDMHYSNFFDEDGQLQTYNGQRGTDAECREIIEKIGTRIIKSNDHEYSSYIDMNDDLGMNVYIGTFRQDEDHIIDRIWAIYGPGGVYSANNNGRALLQSREEVNNPRTGRSRSRSGSRGRNRSRSGSGSR
jgi:hypothetical protein